MVISAFEAPGTQPPGEFSNSNTELRQATRSIANCLENLIGLGLTRYLPSSAVECTALPLALAMLDEKLADSPSAASRSSSSHAHSGHRNTQESESHNTLIVLERAMKDYQAGYNGAGWVSKAIKYFMECTYLDQPAPSPWAPQSQENTNSQDENRTDVLMRSPTCYLRMAFTIDLSLSMNRLPDEADFPSTLGRFTNSAGCFVPFLFDQNSPENADESRAKRMAHKAQLPSLPVPNVDGWIANDRSLYFAQEMGLGPE